ncbi:MAG: glucosamine-6-phosphate deaminase [Spirochaetia bacterium]
MKSQVEERIKQKYPMADAGQNRRVVVIDNFPSLGTITALRFLEWIQQNPEGVISLPTGKTPEYFIREAKRFLSDWNNTETRKELEDWGIETGKKPETRGLRFVQIDEFYPINPRHQNSFYYYVHKYYLEGFGIDPDRSLLINCEEIGVPESQSLEDIWDDEPVDLSLRYRPAQTKLEKLRKQTLTAVDQWCVEYEDKIREMGGIGFFLGGIGPDGHIGFNVRGSDMHSTTRLTEINYETQAAAATDLGGIEVARKRLVITIGLDTITYNKKAAAIIMAAGEAKAKVVAGAVQHTRDIMYPATVLQELKDSRFYLTEGAAKHLTGRNLQILNAKEKFTKEEIERIVIDLALESGRKIIDLQSGDYRNSGEGKILLKKTGKKPEELNRMVTNLLKNKLLKGMDNRKDTRFLHTEPHHDDIMLGYMPYVVRSIRVHSNYHHFATMTSGFTAVTNAYMLDLCRKMHQALKDDRHGFTRLLEEGYFSQENSHYRDHDVYRYLDGIAARSDVLQEEGTLRRFLRDLMIVFEEINLEDIEERVEELVNYFETQYPGKKDLPYIQKLKGMCREWESACLWGYFGWNSASVEDLRLGFYQGEIFTEEPTVSRDVLPVLRLLREVNPDVITVAFDPEASGPDTHYKVLQAIAEALSLYVKETGRNDLEVIGYRNVWYRFHPSEANIFVPVSLNMLTLQYSSFMNTYISQKTASFPSYEMQGPFPKLAQKIQVEQYEMLSACLGREFFYEHESALIRATRGFAFIKSMTVEEFQTYSREIRKRAENI